MNTSQFNTTQRGVVKSEAISSILRMLCSYLSKTQKGKGTTSMYNTVAEVTLQCGRIVGLDENDEFKANKECIKNLTVLFHHILFVLFKESHYKDMLKLLPMIRKLILMVSLIPDEKEKKEATASHAEMDKIFWTAATKLEDPSIAIKLCCGSTQLLLASADCDILSLCQRLTRVLRSYSFMTTDAENLQTLFNCVTLKNPRTELRQEEENAVEEFLEDLLLELNKNAPSTNSLRALKNLVAQGIMSQSKVQVAEASLRVVHSLSSANATFKKTLSSYRESITNKKMRSLWLQLMLSLCNEIDSKSWIQFPPSNITYMLEFLEENISSISELFTFKFCLLFCIMLDHNICSTAEDQWEDHKIPGIKLVCAAMTMTNSNFKSLDGYDTSTAINCFVYLSRSVYTFIKSSNYFEVQILMDVFMKCVFHCMLSLVNYPEGLEKLLHIAVQVFENSMLMLNKPGGDNIKNKLLHIGLLLITALYQFHKNIHPLLFSKLLKCIIKRWCELREKMCIGEDNERRNTKQLWKMHKAAIVNHFSVSVNPPDWREVLTLEIFSYSEYPTSVELQLSAAKSLQPLIEESEDSVCWWYSSLALAHARNQDDREGCNDALVLATSVVSKLQLEISKNPTKESLAGIIHAYYQQFISTIKKQRKENEKLAEIPLLVRAPLKRTGNVGESHALETWEEGQELSQLGQVLSCRSESRIMHPLSLIVHNADLLINQGIAKDDSYCVTSTLHILECSGYICCALGHYWLAMKHWSTLYILAQQAQNPTKQLIALSMMLSRYCLESNSDEEHWILENSAKLKEELSASISTDTDFTLKHFSLCHARSLMLSNRQHEAIDLILEVLNNDTTTIGYRKTELTVLANMLASQLMVSLPVKDHKRKILVQVLGGPMDTAYRALMNVLPIASSKNPAERDQHNLRRQELMIDAGLWMARFATLSGSNKLACMSLHYILVKTQCLMYSTRVAQILSCLGDIDLMTPDKLQLDQRLYWNRKILSLGIAIEGGISRNSQNTYTVGDSPTKFTKKEYQLTAACSVRCSKTENWCILCKNPLYQFCKVHYAFLVEENENTFLKLCRQLETTYKEQVIRLWNLTWKKLMRVKQPGNNVSTGGWISLLLAPISLLECRQILAIAGMNAIEGKSYDAVDKVSNIISRLKLIKHETAPLILRWAQTQLISCQMQNSDIGEFSIKLQAPSVLPVSSAFTEFETVSYAEPPRTPSPPPNRVPKAAPKQPRRRLILPPPENVSFITPPVHVPKLILPDETPSIKGKMLYTIENSALPLKAKSTAIRTKKGKENLTISSCADSDFQELTTKNAKKSVKVKKGIPTSVVGTETSLSPTFSVFCDSSSNLITYKKYMPKSPTIKVSAPTDTSVKKSSEIQSVKPSLNPVLLKYNISSEIDSNIKQNCDDSPVFAPKSSQRKKINVIESSPDSPKSNLTEKSIEEPIDSSESQSMIKTYTKTRTNEVKTIGKSTKSKVIPSVVRMKPAAAQDFEVKSSMPQMKAKKNASKCTNDSSSTCEAVKTESKTDTQGESMLIKVRKQGISTRKQKEESLNLSNSSVISESLLKTLPPKKTASRGQKRGQQIKPKSKIDVSIGSDVLIIDSSLIETECERP